jgi:hypothetical protein
MKCNEHQPSHSSDAPEHYFSGSCPKCINIGYCDKHVTYVDVEDLAGQLVRIRPAIIGEYWLGIEEADGTLLIGLTTEYGHIPAPVVGTIERVCQRHPDAGSSQIACFPGLEGWNATDEASTTSNASDRSIRFGTCGDTVVITSTGRTLIDGDAQDWRRAQQGADPLPDTSALRAAVVTAASMTDPSRQLRSASAPLGSAAIAYGILARDVFGCSPSNNLDEVRYVPCRIVSHSDLNCVLLSPMGGGSVFQLWLDPNEPLVFGCPDDELFHGHSFMKIGKTANEPGFKHYVSPLISLNLLDETTAASVESNRPVAALHSGCTVKSDGGVQVRVSLVAAPTPA